MYIQFDPEKGVVAAERQLALARKLNWPREIVMAYSNLGMNRKRQSNYPAALTANLAALQVAEELQDPNLLASTNGNIGILYFFLKDFDKSLEYYRDAIKFAEASGNKRFTGFTYTNLAAVFSKQGKHDSAVAYMRKALRMAEERGDLEQVSRQSGNLGAAYAEQGKYNEALVWLHTSVRMANKIGQPAPGYIQLGNLGSTYLNIVYVLDSGKQVVSDSLLPGNRDSLLALAKHNLELSIEGCRRLGLRKNATDFSEALSNVHRKKGDHESALAIFKEHTRMKDSIFSAENKETIKNLEDKREIELRDKQIKISALELAAQKQSAAQAASLAAVRAIQQSQQLKLRQSALDLSNNQLSLTQIEKEVQSLAFEKQQGEYQRAQREKDNQLKLAAQQSKIQQLEIRSSRRARYAFGGGLLLLGAFAFVVTRQSRLRKRANQQLAVTNAQLDEANRVKARFFGILSHDLRAPIANLTTYLYLQREAPEAMDEASKAAHSATIEAAANNLLSVMEDVLLWSKGQMTSFKPQITTVHVLALFEEIRKLVPQGISTDVVFENPDLLDIDTDENFLKTIMRNLTANALKALGDRPDGRVVWRAWKEAGGACLSITDNGPGMSTDQVQAMFSESAVTSVKSGLGLHIVRDFAQMLGQRLEVESAPGKGTTFVLRMAA